MPKTRTTFTKGSKAASKAGSKPRKTAKKTLEKEASMRRVLDEQTRRELGIEVSTANVLDQGMMANVIKLMYLQGSGLIAKDDKFEGRKIDVKALNAIYDRIESKKQFVQTEQVNQIPTTIDITVNGKKPTYDRDKDPEVTNYAKPKLATESSDG